MERLDAEFSDEVFPNQALRAVLALASIACVSADVAALGLVAYIRGNVPV